MAHALSVQDQIVTGADYVSSPGGPADAISTTLLSGMPTHGDGYLMMTTGNANIATDPNEEAGSGEDLGGGSIRGDTDFDVTILRIDLSLPEAANCLTFDFRFLSEEYPEYVGGRYNDAFIAELDSSTWSTSGSEITAPNNFAFGPNGEEISVNATGFTTVSPANAEGTTYDSATPLLEASTPVTGGSHALYLSIFDQGDGIYDSAVFLDNLNWGRSKGANCDTGTGLADSPVLLVHGIDWVGDAGVPASGWDVLAAALKKWGWSGAIKRLAYYENDSGYGDGRIDHHGAHGSHLGDDNTRASEHTGNSENRHNANTDIKHLAYHWAWYVYDHYTSQGASVKAVGHSMGGLIMRYAIGRVQESHPAFPPELYVDEVITLGSPHGGTNWSCPKDQCRQMHRNPLRFGRPSRFIQWLQGHANNPQATFGTEWTAMGSYDDNAMTPRATAVDSDMDAEHRVVYLQEASIEHADYKSKKPIIRQDADVRYLDGADEWRRFSAKKCNDAPWPVRWIYLTLDSSESVAPCS